MSFFKKTDIQGLLLLAGALFLSASLASYHPFDPSLNSLGQEPISNRCGYVGAFLSDLFYQAFGGGAWLIVLLIFKRSLNAFAGQSRKSGAVFYFIEAVFLFAFCGSLSLLWPDVRFFQDHIGFGGALGEMTASGLKSLFHTTGSLIILFCSLVSCFCAQTHKPLRLYMKTAFDFLKSTAGAFKNISIELWQSLLHLTKKSSSISLPPLIFNQEPVEKAAPIEDLSFLPESQAGSEENFDPEDILPSSSLSSSWDQPEPGLLPDPPKLQPAVSPQEIREQTKKLQDKLSQFSITGEITGVKSGPAVTLFEFRPADSVKVGKITGLADDLSMALSAESLRIIAPIPGRNVVGIEASNLSRETVFFKDIVKDPLFHSQNWTLPLILGRYVDGSPAVQELAQMPHLMVAGSTGSGKSVFVTAALAGLLMRHSPETLRLILIDPKQVDLCAFEDIPHLLFPPVTNVSKALDTLNWTLREMNKRYRSLNQFHVRGLKAFNHVTAALNEEEIKNHSAQNHNAAPEQDYYYQPLSFICVIIEEFGDLMASPKKFQVEQAIVRLAQMARACGIHLILATQSPRKDVVTGLIKTNIPGRISFKVSSKIDSRVILDESGAERLLAKGDMLFLTPSSAKIKRCHGPYISEEEISLIVEHWKSQGRPEYSPQSLSSESLSQQPHPLSPPDEDMEKYQTIRSYVASLKTVSTSSLQRRFRLGYPRAARMMELFEEEGIVGPAQGSRPREVLQNK